MKLEINYKKNLEKYKHMETKQHATKQPVGQQKDGIRNSQIPSYK